MSPELVKEAQWGIELPTSGSTARDSSMSTLWQTSKLIMPVFGAELAREPEVPGGGQPFSSHHPTLCLSHKYVCVRACTHTHTPQPLPPIHSYEQTQDHLIYSLLTNYFSFINRHTQCLLDEGTFTLFCKSGAPFSRNPQAHGTWSRLRSIHVDCAWNVC